ncbi:hypothetical protein ABAC460_13495 [Asticcacaulis sp. AC460]|uniref:tetratricopeptide repeat-containing sulfotransferase family protein n=1 Tax=Asticcacaulis sp. AC460 TaxID=1282360 RepID=UPI0003C3FB26|nr:sulfotransferase [Asticcacaulis sp. AC460]ESQ89302.1 hypothetical protein ABAC460_13495 [Asticcacaulis sp. AC460]
MTTASAPDNRVLQAIDRLKTFDRRGAVALLREEFANGSPTGDRWRSIARLSFTIGELSLSHEAARRYAMSPPQSLDRTISYFRELIRDGHEETALKQIDALPVKLREHSSILHLLGTIATQTGDFRQAESHFRRALAQTPLAPQSWFALSVIKTFSAGDPDISLMEALKPDMKQAEPKLYAQFVYALAKAYDDTGDRVKAYQLYQEGAEPMRAEEAFDLQAWNRTTDQLIRDYQPEKFKLLTPSGCDSERVTFVNGAPRSGTTLVEQILASHSQFHDGAELNLLRAALIPAGDFSLLGALNYQLRNPDDTDPWGEIGRDYLAMITERFGSTGRIIDKTLNHSRLMGLLLHTLPNARVIWLRRNPADCALSCFRTYFTASIPWSWSVSDIAAYMKSEDRLHTHWASLFPDRILTVPYEELTADPRSWIPRILAHVGVDAEPQVFEPHKSERSVMTASVAQVRNPISTSRVGASQAYAQFLEAFQRAYQTA